MIERLELENASLDGDNKEARCCCSKMVGIEKEEQEKNVGVEEEENSPSSDWSRRGRRGCARSSGTTKQQRRNGLLEGDLPPKSTQHLDPSKSQN